MRNAITTVFLFCLTVFAAAQSPADGKWAFEMNSPMGAVSAQVTLKADGETLTGNFDLGGGRTWPVEQGTIKGDQIAFIVNRDRPSGGSMTYEMKGTVKGDTITGSAAAMGTTVEWTMARAK